MRRCYSARLILLGALLLAPLVIAKAGTVHGTVVNGTTGKAAPGIDLVLIQLQGGMQEVAHSKSGAQGEFTFDHPGLGAQPMLVRAAFRPVRTPRKWIFMKRQRTRRQSTFLRMW